MRAPRVGDRVIHKATQELVRVLEVEESDRLCVIDLGDGTEELCSYPEQVELYALDASKER